MTPIKQMEWEQEKGKAGGDVSFYLLHKYCMCYIDPEDEKKQDKKRNIEYLSTIPIHTLYASS